MAGRSASFVLLNLLTTPLSPAAAAPALSEAGAKPSAERAKRDERRRPIQQRPAGAPAGRGPVPRGADSWPERDDARAREAPWPENQKGERDSWRLPQRRVSRSEGEDDEAAADAVGGGPGWRGGRGALRDDGDAAGGGPGWPGGRGALRDG
eukprot:2254209-Pyramimonas_sp.AAC.1